MENLDEGFKKKSPFTQWKKVYKLVFFVSQTKIKAQGQLWGFAFLKGFSDPSQYLHYFPLPQNCAQYTGTHHNKGGNTTKIYLSKRWYMIKGGGGETSKSLTNSLHQKVGQTCQPDERIRWHIVGKWFNIDIVWTEKRKPLVFKAIVNPLYMFSRKKGDRQRVVKEYKITDSKK